MPNNARSPNSPAFRRKRPAPRTAQGWGKPVTEDVVWTRRSQLYATRNGQIMKHHTYRCSTSSLLLLLGYNCHDCSIDKSRPTNQHHSCRTLTSHTCDCLRDFVVKVIRRESILDQPCPEGLEEAELLVEQHQQRLFGGQIKHSTYATDWKRAYAQTLQKAEAHVERATHRAAHA